MQFDPVNQQVPLASPEPPRPPQAPDVVAAPAATVPAWKRVADAASMQRSPVVVAAGEPRGDARAALLDALETWATTGDNTKATACFRLPWELEVMKGREFADSVGRYYQENGLGEVDSRTMTKLEDFRAAGSIVKGRNGFAALDTTLASLTSFAKAPSVEDRLSRYQFTMFQSGVSGGDNDRAVAAAQKMIAAQMVRLGKATLAEPDTEASLITLAAGAVRTYGPIAGLSQRDVETVLAPAQGRIAGALHERVAQFASTPPGLLDRWMNGGPAKKNTLYKKLKASAVDRGALKYELNTALRERYANTSIEILQRMLREVEKPDATTSVNVAHGGAALSQYYARVYALKARWRLFGASPSAEKLAEIKRLDSALSQKLRAGPAAAGAFVAMSFHIFGIVLHPFTHLVG